MIESRHTLANCTMCGDMVVCADCGNNCCNGGTKELHGRACGCAEAYSHQTAWYEDPRSVTFAKDVRPVAGNGGAACSAS